MRKLLEGNFSQSRGKCVLWGEAGKSVGVRDLEGTVAFACPEPCRNRVTKENRGGKREGKREVSTSLFSSGVLSPKGNQVEPRT